MSGVYPQEAPFSVQVEFSEGCNLYCSFCGLQGIREKNAKNYKFMEENTVRSLAQQMKDAGWTSRIEIAMHGEPTMNPAFVDYVRVIRSYLPKNQIMITSNGGGLLRNTEELVLSLFDAGLNILALDDYEAVRIIDKVRDKEPAIRQRNPKIEFYEYPRDQAGNPHRRGPVSRKMVSYLRDPTVATNGTHATITNHAGAAFPKDYSKAGKRCHRPFRELAVRWDGSVAVCCNDWRGEYNCGNIVEQGLMGVWHGIAMDAARRKLYAGQRDFGPCHGCNAVSYRAGFLPDKSGKDSLPAPDEGTQAVIDRVLSAPPLTTPVKRPWEIDTVQEPVK